MVRVILLAVLVGLPVVLEAQLPGGGGGDGSPLVELQKGIGLLRQGKTAEARELFSTLADRDSLSPLPCYYLALAEIELGASAAAVTARRTEGGNLGSSHSKANRRYARRNLSTSSPWDFKISKVRWCSRAWDPSWPKNASTESRSAGS